MRKLMILAGLVAGSIAAAPAGANSVTVGLDAFSHYVWRGALLADEVTVQPSAWASVGETNLSVGVWSSFAMQNRSEFEAADRVDLIADYLWSAPLSVPLSARVGFREYTFPNGPDGSKHTEEAYAGVRLSLPMLLASLTVFQDFNVFDGTYARLGLSPFLSPLPALDVRVEYAMARYESSLRFNDFTATARWRFPLVPLVDVGPEAGFSISNLGIYEDNKNWWVGVTARIRP